MKNFSLKTICFATIVFMAACQIAYSSVEALTKKLSECNSYEAYENCAKEIKSLIDKDPKGKKADKLYYLMAKTRIEELAFLAKENDIESVRRYMGVSNKYFDEAAMMLDKASQVTSSKSLKLDVLFSKFLIFREKFNKQRIAILLDEMVTEIASFSSNVSQNKKELDRLSEKFFEKGLEEDALRLKVLYAKKVGHEGARQIASELKSEGDLAFDKKDYKKADIFYDQYLILSSGVLNEHELAEKMIAVADKYFDKMQYGEALRYYDNYMTKYRDLGMTDYVSYKIAECLYAVTRYDAAVSQFEAFLNLHTGSKWFNPAFKSLCNLYYKNANINTGIDKLKALTKLHPTVSARDYAELLIGLLYYGQKKYDEALQYFKNVKDKYPDTSYDYMADKLIEDIDSITKNKKEPAYSFGSEETYKAWGPYTIPHVQMTASETVVKTGSEVKITMSTITDLDQFGEYLYDASDRSRLPKKVRDGKEEDLLSIGWNATSGKLKSGKEATEKIWVAPNIPGEYKISAKVEDLGLTRPPDEGTRQDQSIDPVSIVITVTK
jgi:outer membrane protein assembly factor BamD (BamD/ComL family)